MATNQAGVKIYLPLEVADELRRIAQEEDRTVTGLIRLAINDYLATRAQTVAA